MSTRRPARARVRIDFASGRSLGPGKVDLLEAIGLAGSLSEGARVLGLSYRRAWLLLDDLNSTFDEPVATTSAGGAHGGGATLTAFGKRLIRSYRALEERTNRAALRLGARLEAAPAAKSASSLARQRLARPLKR